MSITKIAEKRTLRNFSTYDLEWSKGSEVVQEGCLVRVPKVTLVGVYDLKKGYRHYRTINAFLDGELTKANSGRWYYAHAGGLSDMLFVLQMLVRNAAYSIEASFSGSSAIIVSVTRGRSKWTFVDSLWLFGTALANVAKWVGMEKGSIDFETEDFAKLVEYNHLDCLILWRAIDAFETALLQIGGELMMTLASCAMRLFRRQFLSQEIVTHPEVNIAARASYHASRVEVIEHKANDGFYYDLNSSFPYAMTKPAPGNIKSMSKGYLSDAIDALYLAEVDVEVPECRLPPLPYRHEGSVFFPVGKWTGWFNQVDLRLLEEMGGKIGRVGRVVNFEPFYDLAAYANTLYERRIAGKTEFDKVVYKLLLNSLYGKFGESRTKQQLVVNPKYTTCPHDPPHPTNPFDPTESSCMSQLMPGIWLLENEIDVPHECVPISSQTVSLARANLLGHMVKCDSVHYCDTDGFSTNQPDLPTGTKLGELKLELVFKEAEFISPKVYRIDGKSKAKGMSLRDKVGMPSDLTEAQREKWVSEMSLARWIKLRDGHTIEIERMARVRELYRSGNTVPITRKVVKQLRGVSRPKRRLLADNNTTTPWQIEELSRPWKK
jgi:hypothetical protein